ncbi:hypothetical protein RA28_00940 [Ruegeria sp. ANG-S4]|nr:hypothetical protein RA28_00940 [Ruegeria sp. ANG-S4]
MVPNQEYVLPLGNANNGYNKGRFLPTVSYLCWFFVRHVRVFERRFVACPGNRASRFLNLAKFAEKQNTRLMARCPKRHKRRIDLSKRATFRSYRIRRCTW